MGNVKKMEADVVVVGSGPGGAVVARDLVMKGLNVILLERGGDNKPTGTAIAALKYVGGAKALNNGVFISKEGYQIIRALTNGGTSMMYLGCAWDPPKEVLDGWGINLDEETEKIKAELNVNPLPDSLIGPRAKAMTASAVDLGYDWKKIPKFVKAENCRANCQQCMFGCPHDAKWQARDWVLDAIDKGLNLILNAKCQKIISEKGKAVGVMATGPWNQIYEIRAKAVVSSAGGVGSPGLLQRSGLNEAGQSFFFDPFIVVSGYTDTPLKPKHEFPMATGVHLDEEGVMVTDMSMPWVVLADNSVFSGKPLNMLKTKTLVGMLVKARDDMDGGISPEEKILSKPLSENDRKKLKIGEDVATDILKNMGAKNIWASNASAAHPGGTCGIGRVVNSDLETRIKNFFVVDASVIPEPWGLPPTLTVASLARRLSGHIENTI